MGKTALVTGGSEGIGREFCRQLVRQGYRVHAVARNEARLQELQTEIARQSGELTYQIADLSNTSTVTSLAAKIADSRYDLLINNAGVGAYGSFDQLEMTDHRDVLQINICALVELSHGYLRTASRGGAIINVSSTLGFIPASWAPVYSASKAFVTSFSESLWAQYKDRDIYIMNLCPGATFSEFHRRASRIMERQTPAHLAQSPEEVVHAALSALKQRRNPTVISGRRNQMAILTARLLSRKRLAQILSNAD